MKKIKVCFHIMNMSNCGGTERVTSQIANLLLENYDDYEVHILSNFVDKEIFFDMNKKVIFHSHYYKKKRFKPTAISYIFKTAKFLKENDIDIIITVDSFLALVDVPASKMAKCTNIIWEHFNFLRKGDSRLVRIAKKITCKYAKELVVLTKRDQKLYEDNNKKLSCNITQIYNPFLKKDNSKKYNFKSNTIISCGRLENQKGFDFIPLVAAKVNAINDNYEWIILGEGSKYDELNEKIKELNLENNVKLLGKQKNVDDYYNKSKFFVMTSRYEGMPLVLLEAKANKLPIISFDIDCGPSEEILDGKNGYLIEPFDTNEMASKINELLCDSKKCLEFSKNSDLNTKEFNPSSVIKKWDKLLKKCYKNRS